MSQVAVAAAALACACSSLKVGTCGEGMVPYEAVQRAEGKCSIYCVPEGECENSVQTGTLDLGLGITEQGDCKSKGFTEPVEMGDISAKVSERLKYLWGPCKGISLAQKLQKPAKLDEPKAAPSQRVCGYEQVAFEAINPAFPGVCAVFCVPEGQCHMQAMSGGLAYLGVTGQGNCWRKGYTALGQPGNMTESTQSYLRSLTGQCAGMTMKKFQQPPAEEMALQGGKKGRLCKPSQTPYEAVAQHNSGMCSVYCIPAGDCEGQVQAGGMAHLGITGQGNCRGQGFTERMQYATTWAKYVQGPCMGMEVMNFQKPALATE